MRDRILSEQFRIRLLVGVTGGSASGKTSLCKSIADMLQLTFGKKTAIVTLDSFYKPLPTGVDPSTYNFDSPDSINLDQARQFILALMRGQSRILPNYCFKTHRRIESNKHQHTIYPAEIILFEGIFAFNDQVLRDSMIYKIFVSCDNDVRFCRRVNRDINERGRTFQGVVKQYLRFVRPSYHDFIEPMMKYANLIIPSTINNLEINDFIVQNLINICREIQETLTQNFFFGLTYHFFKEPQKDKKRLASDYLVNDKELSKIICYPEDDVRQDLKHFINKFQIQKDSEKWQEYMKKIIKEQFIFNLVKCLQLYKNIRNLNVQVVRFESLPVCQHSKVLKKVNKYLVTFFPIINKQSIKEIAKRVPSQREVGLIVCTTASQIKAVDQAMNIQGLYIINLLMYNRHKDVVKRLQTLLEKQKEHFYKLAEQMI